MPRMIQVLTLAALSFLACSDPGAVDPDPDSDPVADDQDTLYQDVTSTHLPSLGGLFTMDVALADFDGDGDIDALLAIEFGQNRLLLNDGNGRFTDATSGRLPSASHDSEDIAVGDFDGDGDLDAFVVSEDDRTNEYYVNDGTGRFTPGEIPVTGTSNGVVTGDIDADGDLDLIVGNAGREFVLVNDGSGGWTDEAASRIPPEVGETTQDVELGDVDGDGDLDLLIGNEDGNRLLLNDGNGFFSDGTSEWLPIRPNAEETREADFGDVDGDGDLDVLFANTNSSVPGADPANRILLNQSNRFVDGTDAALPAGARRNFDGEFWDVDGDGDLDIVAGSLTVSGGQAVLDDFRVLLNDGEGIFTLAEDVFPSSAVGFGFDTEMADLNGDGLGDFYLASRGSPDRLLLRRP